MNSKIRKRQEDSFNRDYFKVYENDAKREDMYRSEIKTITQYHSKGKILDVGCGIGKFLSFFDDNKWDKYGTEVSSYAIGESKKNKIMCIFHGGPKGVHVITKAGTSTWADASI